MHLYLCFRIVNLDSSLRRDVERVYVCGSIQMMNEALGATLQSFNGKSGHDLRDIFLGVEQKLFSSHPSSPITWPWVGQVFFRQLRIACERYPYAIFMAVP